jgi:hypothetical protein
MLGFGFSQNPFVMDFGCLKSSNLGPIGFLKKGNILEIKFSNAFQALPGRPDGIKKEHENEPII